MRRRPFHRLTGDSLRAELDRAGPTPWAARAQDFQAGGIAVGAVVVLWPDLAAPGGPPAELSQLWPVVVVVLDERAYRVAPAFRELLTTAGLPLTDSHGSARVWAEWSVLDGPTPLAKLSVHAPGPERVDADLVFPAQAVSDVLYLAALGAGIGLMAEQEAHSLPSHGTLQQALRQVVLVPTLPSSDLLALIDSHGWSYPRSAEPDRDDDA
jgi:hypothetical protein